MNCQPLYIVGPTGSGKSAFAIELAQEIGGEIVNADAFQLYRDLNICTAKPTASERALVPHHLYDVLASSELCDAQFYSELARPVIAEIIARDKTPIIVGGSGLYVKALTHGLSNLPSDESLRLKLVSLTPAERIEWLLVRDPAAAQTVSLENDRYVTRALEICLLTNQPQSELRKAWTQEQPKFQGVRLVWERAALCERINKRVLQMIEAGLVAEIAALPQLSATAAKAIGVREVRAHFDGELTLDEAIANIQASTRQYARRQEKWFKRETGFKVIAVSEEDTMEGLRRRVMKGLEMTNDEIRMRNESRAQNRFAIRHWTFHPHSPFVIHPMPTVRINLAERSYDVIIGNSLLTLAGKHAADLLKRKTCAVITDSNVGPLYAKTVVSSLVQHGINATLITVPAGESSKSMAVVEDVCRQMLRASLDRKSFLIALGGGVIGDLAGFAASIFLRGIPFIQIPTTVLSQVDSSVGGKTGVNTPEGKNLLGTFSQPSLVLADVDTLSSLPKREWNEGFAEIIKHAAIRDAAMFDAINVVCDGDGGGDMTALIARNVAIKARIVEADEHELTGERALLNFGHTIGHAIEASVPYGELLHGEAISLGMVAAARLSTRLCGLKETDAEKIITLLGRFHLPTTLPAHISSDAILGHMKHDKKFSEGKIHFVLLRAAGDAFVSSDVTAAHVIDAVRGLRC